MTIQEKLYSKLNTVKNFILFLIARTKSDTILRVASSLSYTSLIALVPLFAIGLAIFSAFPVFSGVREQLQSFLLTAFTPDIGSEIEEYFDSFIGATSGLTTLGVVGLAITAILMLSTIENSFNFIFKVTKARRLTTKITLYWTVITLGPLLLGAALSLRGYIQMMPQELVNTSAFRLALPNILTILFLVLVYMLVPNRKVKILHAMTGSFVAVILLSLLRTFFKTIVVNGAMYKTLYGALATLPILLVWMYCVWAVVIFGAVITSALGEFKEENIEKTITNTTKQKNKK